MFLKIQNLTLFLFHFCTTKQWINIFLVEFQAHQTWLELPFSIPIPHFHSHSIFLFEFSIPMPATKRGLKGCDPTHTTIPNGHVNMFDLENCNALSIDKIYHMCVKGKERPNVKDSHLVYWRCPWIIHSLGMCIIHTRIHKMCAKIRDGVEINIFEDNLGRIYNKHPRCVHSASALL